MGVVFPHDGDFLDAVRAQLNAAGEHTRKPRLDVGDTTVVGDDVLTVVPDRPREDGATFARTGGCPRLRAAILV